MAFNLQDPDFLRNPGPTLARLRDEGPLVSVKIPVLGRIWLTTSDATTREVLKDTDLFRRDPQAITGKTMLQTFWWMPKTMAPLMQNLVVRDDPDHKRLRRLVEQAFARQTIEDMRPRIEALADELLDRIEPHGPVDIVKAYTRELPFEVICELLGLPPDTRETLRKRVKPISGASNLPNMMWAMLRLKGALKVIRDDIERARVERRTGLMGDLVRTEENGDRLSEDELLAMVFTLFVAGHETTVHLLNNAILAAIDTPGLRQLPSDALPLAIEEFMRFFTPAMMSKAHFVARDVTWHGVDLKKGDKVSAFLLAANHDPSRHSEPDILQPGRRPNPQLGFGHGPHVCLGMQLARTEAHVALERLFTRHPNFALEGPRESVRPTKRIGILAPGRLTLRLSPTETGVIAAE